MILHVALGVFSPTQRSLLCRRNQQRISPYLHLAPSFSLQSAEQQGSASWYKRPGSHSSPSSTLEFPHTLLLRSLKHSWALTSMVLWMDFLLQLENIYRVTGEKSSTECTFLSTSGILRQPQPPYFSEFWHPRKQLFPLYCQLDTLEKI